MADLTLNEYYDIPEEEMHNILQIERERGFNRGAGAKGLKNPFKIECINIRTIFDEKFRIFPMIRYFLDLLHLCVS